MELTEIESELEFAFPERHRKAILDSNDPIHKACDFLGLTDSQHRNILGKNEWLHGSEFSDPWPDFLVAFASNGCGDYYAYDTRQRPATIIYIDPDDTVEGNLRSSDKLCYDTFETWYESKIEPYTCRRCRSREARLRASEDRRFLVRVCPNCGFEERTQAIEL